MSSLRMCDSTSVGCRKSTELPNDRFTRYRKQSQVGQWNIGDSLWIKSQISASDGCSVTPRITPMWAWSWHHVCSILCLGMSWNTLGILSYKITWYIKPNKWIQLDFNPTVIMQLNFEYLPEYKPIHISSWALALCFPLLNFKVYLSTRATLFLKFNFAVWYCAIQAKC